MSRLLKSILLIVLLEMCIFQQAQEANLGPYIYHIISHECENGEPKEGTGFRLKNVEGIITALHVVVGCENDIIAKQTGQNDLENLKIIKVDFERDIAILSSSELEVMPKEGLDMAVGDAITQVPQLKKGLTVTVAGFQFDESVWREFYPYIVGPNPTTTLDTVTGITRAFEYRGSPRTDLPVIQLAGNLYPGHSGAPILLDGKVVGVGLGGLDDGEYNFGWAAQWNTDIYEHLSPKDDRTQAKIDRIKGMSLDHVFSFSFPDSETLVVEIGHYTDSDDRDDIDNDEYVKELPEELNIDLNAFQKRYPLPKIRTVDILAITLIDITNDKTRIANSYQGVEITTKSKEPPFNNLEFSLVKDGIDYFLQVTHKQPPGVYFLGSRVSENQPIKNDKDMEGMFAFGELPPGVDKNQYDRPVDFYDLEEFCFYRDLEASESSPYQVQWTDLMLCPNN